MVTPASDWPVVGRDEELTFGLSAVDRDACRGLVVAGQAGVGKSRLAREIVGELERRGHAVAWTIATPTMRGVPFGTLASIVPEGADAQPHPVRTFHAVARRLRERAAERTFVLAIDDAHHLDGGSAALALHLVQTGAAFVLATLRSGEPEPDAVTTLWKDELAVRIDLPPLSERDVRVLLEAVLGGRVHEAACRRLWDVTRGNPLFLRELVVALVTAGSLLERDGVWTWTGGIAQTPRLEALVEARIRDLGDDERRALEVLAFGEPIDASLLRSLVGAATLEAVERAGLASSEGDVARFAHPFYSDVIRARTPSSTARRIRVQLADAFAGGRPADRDIVRIATLRLDDPRRRDRQMFVEAARLAYRRFDHDLARRLAAAALDVGAGVDAALVAAAACHESNLFAEAEYVLADHEAEAFRVGGTIARTYLARRVRNLVWGLADAPGALRLLDRIDGSHDDEPWRQLAAVLRAHVSVLLHGDVRSAARLAVPVASDASADVLARLFASYPALVALVVLGRTTEALELSGRLADIAAQHREELPVAANWVGIGRTFALLTDGRVDEVETIASSFHRWGVEHHDPSALGQSAGLLGWAAYHRGRVRTAAAWLREAVAAMSEVDPYAFRAIDLALLAACEAQLGDPDAAARTVGRARELVGVGADLVRADVVAAEAWSAAAGGRVSQARALVLDAADASRDLPIYRLRLLHEAVRLGCRDRDTLTAVVDLASEVDSATLRLYGRHADALARRDGPALDDVANAFERGGFDLLAAEASAEASAAYRDAGAAGASRRATARSVALAARCEGARTPALVGLRAADLTAREREVADLASRGLSNPEIAEELTLSVRTVESHLYRVFAKLGVDSRDDLPSVLAREVQ